MVNHYIYLTRNKLNGMKYLGRRTCYCVIEDDPYFGSGTMFKMALKKYGANNFEKEILAICDSEEEACEKEKELIAQMNAVESKEYYNIAPGGKSREKGFVMSEKELEKKRYLEKQIENDILYGIRTENKKYTNKYKTPVIILMKMEKKNHKLIGTAITVHDDGGGNGSTIRFGDYTIKIKYFFYTDNILGWMHENNFAVIGENEYNKYVIRLINLVEFSKTYEEVKNKQKDYYINLARTIDQQKNNHIVNLDKVDKYAISKDNKVNTTNMDYIHEYAKKSRDYNNFLKLCNKYSNDLGVASVYHAVTGYGSITANRIKDGKLKCTERELRDAVSVLDYELKFKDIANRVGGRKDYFNIAIAFCYGYSEVDNEKLLKKLKCSEKGKKMKSVKSINDAIKKIDYVYNYGVKDQEKIPIKEMYEFSVKNNKK